ncbi:MAG TPA: hypothetical protein PKD54_02730, partial [Pirellulaceae bacterium]|nr:hypothetical protein [Pirellulaceae bacterium]
DTGWIQLDPSALRRRNELGLLTRRYLAHVWKQPIALFGAAKFLLRRFQTLESPNGLAEQALAADYPAVLTVRYEREEVSALRRAAHRTGVTLNSILLAGTFAATDAWLRGQSSYSPHEYLRIIVPISIRLPADVTMPACNRASLVQLDRLSREMADREGLARGIDFELGLIRRWHLDKMFLLAVRVNAVSTRWLQYRTARQTRRATTMLTNLGRPFLKTGLPVEHRQLTMGGHVLSDVELVAPIRAGMPLSLAAVEYAGRLHLTLHYDSRVVSSEPARQFLAGVDERLRQFI